MFLSLKSTVLNMQQTPCELCVALYSETLTLLTCKDLGIQFRHDMFGKCVVSLQKGNDRA